MGSDLELAKLFKLCTCLEVAFRRCLKSNAI